MTEFLRSIKSDLLSRRILPLAVVLAIALLVAVGYALTGSSSPSPVVSASLPSAPSGSSASGERVSVAPENPHVAVSETPGGVRYQSHGPTRDPFTPLVSPPETKHTGSSGSSSSGGSSSGSGTSTGSKTSTGSTSTGSKGSSSSGGTSVGEQGHSAPPAKQAPLYVVSAALATGPVGTSQPVVVTPYDGLKANEPLPSKQDVRLIFERVTADGKGAVFKLVVAPILHGPGICLPSTSECQSIDLAVGQVEELEYVEPSGQTVDYALKVLSINKVVVRANATRVKPTAGTARTKHQAHLARRGRDARSTAAKRK
jgi:hypothetical protein